MKSKFIFTLLALTILCESNAQVKPTRIKVYLLGTFHFAQTDSMYNVLEEKHQKSIIQLCNIIGKQKPDKVFVERQPEFENQNKTDSLFRIFLLNGELKRKNELFQVAFRVGRNLGHTKLYSCDHPSNYGSDYRKVREYANNNNQTSVLEGKKIGSVVRFDNTINEDSLMKKSTLLEYIRWINSDPVMFTSHGSYVANYPLIGSNDFYSTDNDSTLVGAELTANWYKRNVFIYSKIINQLNFKEKAIFLLIGSDRIPILRHLFQSNPYFEFIETKKWLTMK